ncbi:MAG: hypothetical protein KKA42_07825 [candidate division Zixibacteria bacterium]|nr:hypothetical protein [candidate division Zixibacteria bacterium]
MKRPNMKLQFLILTLTLSLVVLGTGSVLARPSTAPPRNAAQPPAGPDGMERIPPVATIDQIIHNQGNIVTTVDNWGYIGGYQFYGYPSAEWPRNSGHDYVGELKYWMGAVSAEGDTLVANSIDDFQGILATGTGLPRNGIQLSTDTTRYYNYDPADTVGAEEGNPALGWRVWSSEANDWVYTQNYNPIESTFFAGGPLSVQESHYRFNDAAQGSPLMGLEMTHTILQWNYCYNEDFMFVILEIKNVSDIDYYNFAFGLYVDIDVGGPDGTGENGRLEDMVASDSTENLAWIYDSQGYDPGWAAKTGVMGTKYLETPDDIGMTALRTGDWALVPSVDPGRYALINSEQYDESLPPTDQYYIQCTRGIQLDAGKTIRVVYALIAGANEEDFRINAALAQELYDNNFVGPEPPAAPTLKAMAGDEKIYLSWNDSSQTSVDPLLGVQDFAGYRLFRSDDRALTWGEIDPDDENECMDVAYIPLAEYRVTEATDPIAHSFIDTGLINGVEYWYALVAFDQGMGGPGTDPLQNGFGLPDGAVNVVAVSPVTDPAGFYEAAATVEHEYTGTGEPSNGNVIPTVFNREDLLGAEYEVHFEDQPDQTYWHLLNLTTGDTVLASQTRAGGEPDLYTVAEGMRVVVRDGDRAPQSITQTALGGPETTLAYDQFLGPGLLHWFGDDSSIVLGGNAKYRNTFELRYTGDSTLAPSLWEGWIGTDPMYVVPFECWNTVTGQRVSLAVDEAFEYDFDLYVVDDGVWQPWDPIVIVDVPYVAGAGLADQVFPDGYGWSFNLDTSVYAPVIGDVLTVEGAPLNGPDDVFSFSVDGINAAEASLDLNNIRVVPDPYYAHVPLWEISAGETQIEFQNLPDICTLRIYSLAGDLVKTIEHTDGSGTVQWNLLTESQQQISSGLYVYHVESSYGDHVGRFAVIK